MGWVFTLKRLGGSLVALTSGRTRLSRQRLWHSRFFTKSWRRQTLAFVIFACLLIGTSRDVFQTQAIAQAAPPPEYYLPENKLIVAPAVSPNSAFGYYDSIESASDPGLASPADCSGNAANRDIRLTELAASLPNDADEILKFVHDSLAFEATYGLKKGALGALLDGDGNAFDHAQFLVELLRSKNICARYKIGAAEATSAQLSDWLGIASLQQAQRVFADGGIPVEQLSDRLRFAHVWVELYGASGSTAYDPSFKRTRPGLSGFSIAAASGMDATGLRNALGGVSMSSPTTDRRYADAAAFDTYLANRADTLGDLLWSNAGRSSLATSFQTTDFTSLSFEDVLGVPSPIPLGSETVTAATRAPLTAYGAAHETWYEVPAHLKTRVRIRVGAIADASLELDLDTLPIQHASSLDVLANRDLLLTTEFTGQTAHNQLSTGRIHLTINGTIAASTPQMSSDAENWPWLTVVEVDQPYAALEGGLADTQTRMQFDPRSTAVIAMSSGQFGERRMEMLSRYRPDEVELSRHYWTAGNPATDVFACPTSGEFAVGDFCYWDYPKDSNGQYLWSQSQELSCDLLWSSFTDFEACSILNAEGNAVVTASADGATTGTFATNTLAKRTALYTILQRAGRARLATSGIASGYTQNHFMVGLSSSELEVEYTHNTVVNDTLHLNLQSGSSFNDRTSLGVNSRQRAMMFAYSSALSGLEGLSLADAIGATRGASFADKARWSIDYTAGSVNDSNPRGLSTGPDGAFRRITPSDLTSQGSAVWSGVSPNGLSAFVNSALANGYTAYLPTWQRLGPEMAPTQRKDRPSGLTDLEWYSRTYSDSGSAILLVNPFTGAVSHLVGGRTGGFFKGGTAQSLLDGAAPLRPDTAGLLIKTGAMDKLQRVDDQNGRLTLSPAPDLVLGADETALTFQRSYSSETAATELGRTGWRHNHQSGASLQTGGPAHFGDGRPAHAAAMIVAIAAALELGVGEIDLDDAIASQLAMNWWTDGLRHSHLALTHGDEILRFYRATDGEWRTETRRQGKLTVTGAPVRKRAAQLSIVPEYGGVQGQKNAIHFREWFDLSGISFVHRSAEGVARRYEFSAHRFDLLWFEEDAGEHYLSQDTSSGGALQCDAALSTSSECGPPLQSAAWRLEKVATGCPLTPNTSLTNCAGTRLDYAYNFPASGGASIEVSDAFGRELIITPSQVSDDTGRTVTFTYQEPAAPSQPVYPQPQFLSQVKLLVNGVQQWEQRYEYEDAAPESASQYKPLLKKVFLPRSQTTAALEYTWTSDHRVASVKMRNGAIYQHGAAGGRSSVTAPDGGVSTAWYDQEGRIVGARDPIGRLRTYIHDGVGRLVRDRAPWGNSTEYAYDSYDNVISIRQIPKTIGGDPAWWSQSPLTTAKYEDGDWPTLPTEIRQPPTTDDPNPGVTTIDYDDAGHVASILRPATFNGANGATQRQRTELTYDSHGRIVETRVSHNATEIFGVPVSYAWSKATYAYGGTINGVVQPDWCLTRERVNPDGLDLTTQYACKPAANAAARGDVWLRIDPRGHHWVSEYDEQRRKIRELAPSPAEAPTDIKSEWIYDAEGNVVTERRWDGAAWRETETQWSLTGAPLLVTDPAGDRVRTCYDVNDRPTTVITPESNVNAGVTANAGRATRTVYNLAGDVERVEQWFSASLNAANDNVCATTSNGAPWTPTGRNGGNVNVHRAFTYGPVADGAMLTGERDASGNLTSFIHEGLGRIIQTNYAPVDGVTQVEVFLRDERGQVLQKRSRDGRWARYYFDALGRETHAIEQEWNQTTAAFEWKQGRLATYDLAGRRMSSATFDYPSWHYRDLRQQNYDAASRASQEWVYPDYTNGSGDAGDNGFIWYMLQQYDANSNRTALSAVLRWAVGWESRWTYDAANRMIAARAGTTANVGSAPWATATFAWDPLSRRTGITRGNGVTSSYAYEPDSDLASLGHAFASGSSPASATFTYASNPSSQLAAVATNHSLFDWTPPQGAARTYGPANALNQIPSETVAGVTRNITWDGLGNMASAPLDASATITSFTHDGANRLKTAARPGMSAFYDYDALDRRVLKAVTQSGATVITRTLWDGADEFIETDATASGNAILRLVLQGPGVDDRVAVIDASGAPLYLHRDRLGSTVATTNAAGQVVETFAYSPHGESSAPLTGTPWRYTGRYFDAETGLYYYRARYYSPWLGQFLQTDPIGTKDDPNLYMYVGLDPGNATDPNGLQTVSANRARREFEANRRRQLTGPERQAEDSTRNMTAAIAVAGTAGVALCVVTCPAMATAVLTNPGPTAAVVNGLAEGPALPAAAGASVSLVPAASAVMGKWGEARLAIHLAFAGTKPTSPFKTSLGPRYFDRLLNGIAYESKAGRDVGLSSTIRTQIAKDAELVASGRIRGAEWHFWRGARPETLSALDKAGIGYVVH